VRGWEGGEAWISTTAMMDRACMAGLLLGVVDREDLSGTDAPSAGEDSMTTMAAEVDLDEQEPAPGATMTMESSERSPGPRSNAASPLLRVVRVLEIAGYAPRIHLASRLQDRGVQGDRAVAAALCDELLAIEAPPATVEALARELRSERKRRGIRADGFLEQGARSERILRRLAHSILSLPEAQLQ
jgi:hypothetical protein